MGPKDKFFTSGNFAPINKEQSYELTNLIKGDLPADLSGVYLKNGPNPKYHSTSKAHHWFEGQGMLHSFRIKDGKVFYCNRYT